MSLEEKLEHFKDTILKDAASERNKILTDMKVDVEKRLHAEKTKFERQAEEFLRKELASAENIKNSIISRAIMESKQLLMQTREEIIEAIYTDAKEKLLAFINSEQYLPYLLDLIKYSCKTAGEGQLAVYVSEKDMELLSPLLEDVKRNLPAGTTFEVAGDDILGGCRVLNYTQDIMVNNALLQKLEASKDSFFETCNLTIE
jgi:V/A-type H+-transporting ATPase subunit E